MFEIHWVECYLVWHRLRSVHLMLKMVKVSDQMIHVIFAVRVRATVGAKQIYRPRERKIEKECDKSTGTMRYTSDETSIVAGQK